jgi:hypothetical protein
MLAGDDRFHGKQQRSGRSASSVCTVQLHGKRNEPHLTSREHLQLQRPPEALTRRRPSKRKRQRRDLPAKPRRRSWSAGPLILTRPCRTRRVHNARGRPRCPQAIAGGTEIRDEPPERPLEVRRPRAGQLVRSARRDRGSALEPLCGDSQLSLAAVDLVNRAGHERCLLGEQEVHRARHLLDGSGPVHGRLGRD